MESGPPIPIYGRGIFTTDIRCKRQDLNAVNNSSSILDLISNTACHRGQLGDDRRPYGSELSVLTGNLLVAKPRTASALASAL